MANDPAPDSSGHCSQVQSNVVLSDLQYVVLCCAYRRNPELKFQTELVVESLICGAQNLYLKDQGRQAIQVITA